MTEIETIEDIQVEKKLDFTRLITLLKNKITDSQNLHVNQILRFEIPVPAINIIKFLGQQKNSKKIYWSERSGDFECGGIGAADIITYGQFSDYKKTISYIYSRLSSQYQYLRYYGGIQFQQETTPDEKWQTFSDYLFILPKFEIIRIEDDYFFACNLIFNDEDIDIQIEKLFSELDAIQYNDDYKFGHTGNFLSREDYPDKTGWQQILTKALKSIESEIIEKVVLARKVILKFTDTPSIYSVLNNLKKINPYSIHFCFQINSDLAFIGGTPELLFHRNHKDVYSEAIAGTRPRGKNEDEDMALEMELLRSDKERREHSFVFESLKDSFNKLCKNYTAAKEVSVIKLKNLQHLYSKLQGNLKDRINDIDILSSLHPTPAVGGYPAQKALKKIEELEPFHRGWYAAPIGWIGNDSAEFAVAIRSGLITGKNLILYSGGGIVEGSDVQSEWQEIENKIANFLNALGINGENGRTK